MDYEEAKRRMDEWQDKQRRKLKRWQKVNWALFTLNVWFGTKDLLNGDYWLAGISLVAVGLVADSIYTNDKLIKQRFYERE